jgi:tellurite resistance protein
MKTTQSQTHDVRPAFKDAWTPGDLVQFEALVSACALVAQSDGRVTERMRTLPAPWRRRTVDLT